MNVNSYCKLEVKSSFMFFNAVNNILVFGASHDFYELNVSVSSLNISKGDIVTCFNGGDIVFRVVVDSSELQRTTRAVVVRFTNHNNVPEGINVTKFCVNLFESADKTFNCWFNANEILAKYNLAGALEAGVRKAFVLRNAQPTATQPYGADGVRTVRVEFNDLKSAMYEIPEKETELVAGLAKYMMQVPNGSWETAVADAKAAIKELNIRQG